MRRTRVIVVGVGHLGRVHARILSKLAAARLVGVVDPSEAARSKTAEACRTNAFADWRALDGKFDAAVIAVPTALHRQVGLELLGHGIHCLIEKPLSLTTAEADELILAAHRSQVVLQVGHVERFNPALAPVRTYLHDPKFIEATRTSRFTGRSTDIGAVLDLMIHDIDLALSIVDAPVCDVDALGMTVLGPHEDVAHARLKFENGCVATLNASRVSPSSVRQMNVWSQEGFTTMDFAARTSSVLAPGDAIRERRIDWNAMDCKQRERLCDELFSSYLTQKEFNPETCDPLTAELEDFVSSIREGHAPRVTGEQARDVLDVAHRILEKIASHAWDGTDHGRIGPMAPPIADVISATRWHDAPIVIPMERKEAG